MSQALIPGEYENEPIPGLPERLPEGEEILWQGSPVFSTLWARAFHGRKLAIYFGVLLLWGVAATVVTSESGAAAAATAGKLCLLGALGCGIVALLARLCARAAIYTITNRRIVLRFGAALPMAINLPFEGIDSVDVCRADGDTGDIALTIRGADQLGYFVLWPFARAWRFGRKTQPMLRAVPDVDAVGEVLSRSLLASLSPAEGEGAASATAAA